MDFSTEQWMRLVKLRAEGVPVVSFLSCGKRKLNRPCPAMDLYCGSYFKLRLRMALKLSSIPNIYILSAKYGVVEAKQIISPYDLKLSDLDNKERTSWIVSSRAKMNQIVKPGMVSVLICGMSYAAGLDGINLLPNAGMGWQMKFMKQCLQETAGFGRFL